MKQILLSNFVILHYLCVIIINNIDTDSTFSLLKYNFTNNTLQKIQKGYGNILPKPNIYTMIIYCYASLSSFWDKAHGRNKALLFQYPIVHQQRKITFTKPYSSRHTTPLKPVPSSEEPLHSDSFSS